MCVIIRECAQQKVLGQGHQNFTLRDEGGGEESTNVEVGIRTGGQFQRRVYVTSILLDPKRECCDSQNGALHGLLAKHAGMEVKKRTARAAIFLEML
jgi:hypothetical protein